MKFVSHLLFLLFILIAQYNKAQIFDPEIRISRESITKQYKLIEIDVDMDGFKDIVSAGEMPDNLCWFRNTGNGDFEEKQVIYTSTDPKTLTCNVLAYDVDNDGDEDLIAFDVQYNLVGFGTEIPYNRNCFWLENQSLGAFGSKQLINADTSQLGRGDLSFFVEDFDGDGLKDIIYGASTTWNKNLGNGMWASFQPITYQSNYLSISSEFYIGDINGDSKVEILAKYSDSIGVNLIAAFHSANGIIDSIVYIANGYNYFSDVKVSDLNQDGNEDVLFCMTNDDRLFLSRNIGNLDFHTPEVILTASNPILTGIDYKLIVKDINNDGLIDVLFNSSVAMYYMTCQGEFEFQQVQRYSGIGERIISIDYNNDLMHDLAGMASFPGSFKEFGSILIFKQSLSETFEDYLILSLDGKGNLPKLSDIDLDGDFDIYFNDGWYDCLGASPLAYSEYKSFFDSVNYKRNNIVGMFDINNDGLKDFFISDYVTLSDSLVFKINSIESEVSPIYYKIPIGFQTRVKDFLEMDFNLDGLQDFVISLSSPFGDTSSLFYKKNSFGNVDLFHSGVHSELLQPNGIKSFDLDENGFSDVLQSTPNGIFCQLNLGSEGFSSPFQLTYQSAIDFYIDDVNGDGNNDIIGCCGLYNISINWGEGDLLFTQADGDSFIPEIAHSPFILNDFDQDGDPDLIAVVYPDTEDYSQQNLNYFENINGTLQDSYTLNYIGSHWLTLGDVDNDLDLDVISLNSDFTKTIFLNKTNIITHKDTPINDIEFSVFPNPAINSIKLVCSSCDESSVVEILNPLGQIEEFRLYNASKESIFQINLKPGLYFIKVSTPKSFSVKKIIIQ